MGIGMGMGGGGVGGIGIGIDMRAGLGVGLGVGTVGPGAFGGPRGPGTGLAGLDNFVLPPRQPRAANGPAGYSAAAAAELGRKTRAAALLRSEARDQQMLRRIRMGQAQLLAAQQGGAGAGPGPGSAPGPAPGPGPGPRPGPGSGPGPSTVRAPWVHQHHHHHPQLARPPISQLDERYLELERHVMASRSAAPTPAGSLLAGGMKLSPSPIAVLSAGGAGAGAEATSLQQRRDSHALAASQKALDVAAMRRILAGSLYDAEPQGGQQRQPQNYQQHLDLFAASSGGIGGVPPFHRPPPVAAHSTAGAGAGAAAAAAAAAAAGLFDVSSRSANASHLAAVAAAINAGAGGQPPFPPSSLQGVADVGDAAARLASLQKQLSGYQ